MLTLKKKQHMELLEKAQEFIGRKMSNMSTSDRVEASREAKALILSINEIYKETKDPSLMDVMKDVTVKKKKIEKRLNGVPLV
jgi:hypothetical protein|tara:strand:- start:393 stop:641 length:249 start_codon:yes stop_codon:yes gene_type:complete